MMKKRNFRTDRNFTERFKEKHRRFQESSSDINIKDDCLYDAFLEVERVLGTKELLKNLVKIIPEEELKSYLEYLCQIYDIEGDFIED